MRPKVAQSLPNEFEEPDDESLSERIFDTHTINAETGDMTEKEVVYFCSLIRKAISDKFSVTSKYKVNTITTYDKETNTRVAKGVSFIYWEKSEVYHILLGRNPDGSERVKIVYVNSDGDEIDPEKYKNKKTQDGDEIDPEKYKNRKIQDETTESGESSDDGSLSQSSGDAWDEGTSFADTMDANGKRKRAIQEALEAGLVPPGYKIQHRNAAPLLPPFVYTRTNKTQALMKGLDSSIEIKMNPFFISPNPSARLGLDYHKLSGEVPKGTTVADLHALFDIFSSHPNYPMITIKKAPVKNTPNETREIAFIVFNPRYNEARFARELMLFTRIGKDTTIRRFDHPWSRGYRP